MSATLDSDLTNSDYHAITDFVSNSMLGEFLESPELYYGRYVAKNIPPREPTPAMRFGSLFHEAVLFGVDNAAVLIPESVLDKSGRRSGQSFKEFAEQHAGQTLLLREDFERLDNMVAAVRKHKHAAKLLNNDDAEVEQSIFWDDAATGLKLKSRLDMRRLSVPLIIDLKTVSDISFRGLAGSCHSFGYHRQCVAYCEAAKAATGVVHDFVFIAVEKEPPHRVACVSLSQRARELGWEDWRGGLDRLAECYQTGDWTTPGLDRVLTIDLPNWAYSDQWEVSSGDGN